ncbi:protein ELC [Typha latifolia]|uniref:protein ELC n=1 Tax=Typha latifolia TaxID=4733 RepID=UPI003C2F5A64
MVPSTSIRLVDGALATTGPKALSYIHHNLKWLIRQDFLSLLDDFPTLSPSVDAFTHDDGTTVNLLHARGLLPISSAIPSVHLTIWLHQRYPFAPPIVYISSAGDLQILPDHPWVDPSGFTRLPYLETWQYPRSNLSDLARNLVRNFRLCPPYLTNIISPSYTSPSLPSKREAVDRLVMRLHYDEVCYRAQVQEELEKLSAQAAFLRDREKSIGSMIKELEQEKARLKRAAKQKVEYCDVLSSWVCVHKSKSLLPMDELGAFEAGDERSRYWLDEKAAELAIDDAMDALTGALEQELVSSEVYLKQVRALARQQFFHREWLRKMEA